MSNWLDDFITDAVRRRLCTKVFCTTCGALDFRRGVVRASGHDPGMAMPFRLRTDAAQEIAKALSGIYPARRDREYQAAVRLIIDDLSSALPLPVLRNALTGSWAGEVLDGMEAHEYALQDARREREKYNSPEGIAERQAAKKQLKQEQHATRLAAKAERDRQWREQWKPE